MIKRYLKCRQLFMGENENGRIHIQNRRAHRRNFRRQRRLENRAEPRLMGRPPRKIRPAPLERGPSENGQRHNVHRRRAELAQSEIERKRILVYSEYGIVNSFWAAFCHASRYKNHAFQGCAIAPFLRPHFVLSSELASPAPTILAALQTIHY